MKTLTVLARDDAKVMKFIAVLTMIYLPSSSLSVSLFPPPWNYTLQYSCHRGVETKLQLLTP